MGTNCAYSGKKGRHGAWRYGFSLLLYAFFVVLFMGAFSHESYALQATPKPRISVTPASVIFGNVRLGSTSSVKTITVRNTGTADLVISSANTTGTDAASFSQSNNCGTVTPGGSCTITATFTPVHTGSATAAMAIASNDIAKPTASVRLSGTAPPPKISAVPAALSFGSVRLGSTSSAKAVMIKNTGTADLVINSVNITGTNAASFSQSNNCATVAAGGSCTITTTFTPAFTGSSRAAIAVSSSDPKKPVLNVALSGTCPAISSRIILDGYINNLSTYPDPVEITYTRKNGASATEKAYPGQVTVLFTTATSLNTATVLITQNGGTVAVQIPNMGVYVATITPGNLNAFLSAMYANSAVLDAFPNGFVSGSISAGYAHQNVFDTSLSTTSLIQTIDLSMLVGCGALTHRDAVGYVAGANGVDVQTNDVTVTNLNTPNAGTSWEAVNRSLITLLAQAEQNKVPIIINMSLRPIPDTAASCYNFYKHYAMMLDSVSKKYPALLKNAVILISGSDTSINQTADFQRLFATDFPNSAMWNNLYFVESQEGIGPDGCGIGYADISTANAMNVLSAPGCNIQVSGTGPCPANGTSFSTPEIANLLARAFEGMNRTVNLTIIAKQLMKFQKNNGGALPTLAQLMALSRGGIAVYPESAFFDAAGGNDVAIVTAPGRWTAASSASWLTITSGTSGTGSGTISYTVASGTGLSERTGTITVTATGFTATVTVTQTIGVTGNWYGTLNMPGAGYDGCQAQTVGFALYLTEDASHIVTGSTSNSRTITTGIRSGTAVTVTLMTHWGARGPYTWMWDGANTITGSMAYFCYSLENMDVILSEGTETFTVSR